MEFSLQEAFLPFAVSIGIGALIGIERERKKQLAQNVSPVGVRTSILLALFGALAGYLTNALQNDWILVFAMTAILLLVVTSHIYLIKKFNRIGITTEVTELLLFAYGAMCTIGLIQMAVMLAIVTVLILSTKEYLHSTAKNVSDRELYDTIKFAIIAFIVLPFLPDQNYDAEILGPFLPQESLHGTATGIDVLNPYRIWFLVVFVSGVSYIGYIWVKLFGERIGITLSGLMGGLYSSTATSLTLSNKSKDHPDITKPFIAGIILACAVSYVKSFLFIRTLNEELLSRILVPLGFMFIYLMVTGLFLMLRSKNNNMSGAAKFTTPFSLKSAVKLGLFIVAALLVAKLSLSYAGIELYYVIAMVSSFFAVDDPIIISTAATAGDLMSMNDAKNIILVVTYLNMIQKAFIMYFFGNKKLVKPLLIIFGGLLLVTGVGFIYL